MIFNNYAWRYSGLIGVAILWFGISLAMFRTGLSFIDNRPISYLGVDPASSVLFSISLLASAFLFISFGFYVRQVFNVTNRFLPYLIIGQIGQIIAAIAPYGMQSQYKRIHTVAAFVLAFSLPFLIRAFAHSQANSRYKNIYSRLVRLELVAFIVGIGLFVFTKGIAPLGEALPAIGFHAWIIVVTFIPRPTEAKS